MTKKELRKLYREKRKELSLHAIEKLNDLILINFQKAGLPFVSTVHTYLPSLHLGEADTAGIIRFLQFHNPGLKIAIPKIDIHSGVMTHYHYTSDTRLVTNIYGIDEPEGGDAISEEDIDLVLVPLLAFDQRGYRVGYGKGYYDRFLAKCRPDAIKAGLCFFDPVQSIDDLHPFDIPLNYCITPYNLYDFGR